MINGDALIHRKSELSGNHEYVIAHGYDEETDSWSHGDYYWGDSEGFLKAAEKFHEEHKPKTYAVYVTTCINFTTTEEPDEYVDDNWDVLLVPERMEHILDSYAIKEVL